MPSDGVTVSLRSDTAEAPARKRRSPRGGGRAAPAMDPARHRYLGASLSRSASRGPLTRGRARDARSDAQASRLTGRNGPQGRKTHKVVREN